MLLSRRRPSGFSLLELVGVLALLGILTAVAMPTFSRVRRDGSVQNARHAVTASLSWARAAAVGYGRTATLRIDTTTASLWIEVDTSQARDRSGLITMGQVNLGTELGVRLRADNDRLCFDSRGLGVATSTSPLAGARIRLVHDSRVDTIVVNSLGRVRHGR